jgi:hypothetical protein
MRQLAQVSLVLCAAACAAPPATAEVFLLKSGGRIEAQLVNPQRSGADPYLLKTELGVRLSLAPAAVQRVVVQTEVEKQYVELQQSGANTIESHWQLAEYCKEAGLAEERKKHLAAIIALDPDHQEARTALGYGKIGGRWMTMDEYMLGQGYVRAGGAWKTPQQLELEVAEREQELSEKRLRKDILRWFDQLGERRGEEARRNLQALRDPRAVPGLVEILSNRENSREARLLCLEILSRMPPGLAAHALLKLAMEDKDAEIRDRVMDEITRAKDSGIAAYFVQQLSSKDNKRINRAAECLARLGDDTATLPLINSLVTTHEYIILPANGGGMSFNSAQGFSAGGKPERKKADRQNGAVLSALTVLHPGTNFQYDEKAWRKWYVEEFTTTQVDLRRDE